MRNSVLSCARKAWEFYTFEKPTSPGRGTSLYGRDPGS